MLTLAAWLCPAAIAVHYPPDEERTIHVGERLLVTLRPNDSRLAYVGPSERIRLVVAEQSVVTIAIDSYDVDASLRIETETGEVVAADDNGGVETDARVTIEVAPSDRFLVIAQAEDARVGDLTLSVSLGITLQASGRDLLEAGAAWRSAAAARALERGDVPMAARHRLEQARRLSSTHRNADAIDLLRSAMGLARECGATTLALECLRALREAFSSQDADDKAIRCAERWVNETRSSRSASESALAFEGLGAAYFDAEDYPRALKAFEQGLALNQQTGDRRLAATLINHLGATNQLLGDFARARSCYERGLDAARLAGDRASEIQMEIGLGDVAAPLGDSDSARVHYKEAVAGALELGHLELQSKAMANLGVLLMSRGNARAARHLYERDLAIATTLGERRHVIESLVNLATTLEALGELDSAQRHIEDALRSSRELGFKRGEVHALDRLARLCVALGDIPNALANARRSLELARSSSDEIAEANSLGILFGIHRRLGDFAAARECAERDLEVSRSIGDRVGEARALGNLGVFFHETGDPARARDFYEKQIEVSRALGDRTSETRGLVNIGMVHANLGDYLRARDCFERGLDLARACGSSEQEAVAIAMLGLTCLEQGDGAAARDYLERHLTMVRSRGDRPSEADALGNLAVAYRALGDLDRARDLAEQSVRIAEAIGSDDLAVAALTTSMHVALDRKSSSEGHAILGRALPALDRLASRSLGTESAAGVRSRYSEWPAMTQDLAVLDVHHAQSGATDRSRALVDAFREVGRWKGLALLEGIAELHAGARNAEASRLRREIREARLRRGSLLEQLSEAIRTKSREGDLDALRAQEQGLQKDIRDRERQLAVASPHDANLDAPRGVGPDELRVSVVTEGTALIDYVPGRVDLYAYVLTSKTFDLVELGALSEIDGQADAFRTLVADPANPGGLATVAQAGRALFDALLAPALRTAGDRVERLVIVPTPMLASLPFEALVVATRDSAAPKSFADVTFVLDRFVVSYAPSSTVLVELGNQPSRSGAERMLLLADPLYPAESRDALPASVGAASNVVAMRQRDARPGSAEWPRLDYTRREAREIATLESGTKLDAESTKAIDRLSKERSAAVPLPGVDVFVGAEASRERLLGDLAPYSLVHLATHGYVDAERPERTALVLAGAGDDVFFAIPDVLDLHLDANLVVLSACETARGHALGGEGVQSLARAFLYAGARSVVASLWAVSDEVTAETMKAFHAQRLGGKRLSDALRQAKLDVRRGVGSASPRRGVGGVVGGQPQATHPFFWAPFIHVGLPR